MNRLADITWRTPDATFKYRVAALVTHQDLLLLCGIDGLDYLFLPGGKVTLGETTHHAMTRELREELGTDLAIGDLVLVVENLYDEAGTLNHELGFYYQTEWPHEPATPRATEPGHHFHWVTRDELDPTTFRPPELIPYLQSPHTTPTHLVLDRRTNQPRQH